ncbi:conserved hypothetical protein [Candidatus Desulfosporosinus infrequens]|uniref:Uncharacterized protein n=1 Tax=Candidatus Desulfosporosinus infrequens TaxID=2043169 RepID=A0A2U3JZ25_9FIRM|nr:conserved hypothetical protein [Candidatus Desulfosporosinus infrequens]
MGGSRMGEADGASQSMGNEVDPDGGQTGWNRGNKLSSL